MAWWMGSWNRKSALAGKWGKSGGDAEGGWQQGPGSASRRGGAREGLSFGEAEEGPRNTPDCIRDSSVSLNLFPNKKLILKLLKGQRWRATVEQGGEVLRPVRTLHKAFQGEGGEERKAHSF